MNWKKMRAAKASCKMTSWYTVVKIQRGYDWFLEKTGMRSLKDTRHLGKTEITKASPGDLN